jgi:acetoacetate decarboxylase
MIDDRDGWTTPLDAPFYPRLPAVYRNVRFQLLLFTARPEAVGRFLPAPLEPSEEGLCAAAGLDVPFCTNYGAFQEAFLVLGCRFQGRSGYYCSHVLHNGPAGIAAGREIYGTPKVFAGITLESTERVISTRASLGGVPVFRLDTVTDEAIGPEELPALAPGWRLKVIPRADGPGLAVKQLVDCSRATRDQTIHFAGRGRGTVQFAASPSLDLTPLAPVECRAAYYFETSYSEHYAEIAYDYLAPAP